MGAPINVKLKEPTETIETWLEEKAQWMALNREARGNPEFFPLTIKAAYAIGVIHSICESVECLLQNRVKYAIEKTYLPAYGVFSSGIDLLGRCVKGESDPIKTGIWAGFKWLVNSDFENVNNDHILIRTSNQEYSINNLVALRNFAAHGQATNKEIDQNIFKVDYEILSEIRPYLAGGLAWYWDELINGDKAEHLCNKLAKANIIRFREWPIFLSWSLFERDQFGEYHGVEEIFNRFDWHVNLNWRV